jgi:S-adenosylmethionine/arginine decarboxylase-like enzyme
MSKGCWGYSVSIDCASCDKEVITNSEKLKKWVTNLVVDIDMIAHGEPQIIHFGEAGTNKEGYTVVQLLTTSAIVAHCCDTTGDAYIDIFSCKWFDNETVIDNIHKHLKPKHYILNRLNRQAATIMNAC